MVSIIIPFKDNVDLLKKCVKSILHNTSSVDYEIILVNNQSQKKETFKYLEEISISEKIIIINYGEPFNYSAINNFAVGQARGDFMLFLNNDTEVISENWLEEMLKIFEAEKVGVVGAKLLYPNGKIQHIGVEMHPKYGPVHTSRLAKEEDIDFKDSRECIAVTGACMMTRRALFIECGGFDEINLPIAYNDIDYCLRARELGYETICTPHVTLYHFESASRKSDIFARIFNRKRYKKFVSEQAYMRIKWGR